MIIELYGPPGAGKSFIIEGIKKSTDSKYEDRVTNIRSDYFAKMVKKLLSITPCSLILKSKIFDIVGDIRETPVYINRTKYEHISNIIMVAFGYKFLKQSHLYMDEGIIHRIIAFSVNYSISIEKTLAVILEFENYLKAASIFYLDVNVDECLNSIRRRDRHICEMDELSYDKLVDYVTEFKIYCDLINNRFQHVIITRENHSYLENLLK